MTRRLQDEFEELAQLPDEEQDRYVDLIGALKLAELQPSLAQAVAPLEASAVIK